MNVRVKRFTDLLRIEINDLEADMRLIEARQDQLHAEGAITSYVFKENLSLIEHEIRALDAFLDRLEGICSKESKDCENLSEVILKLEDYYNGRAEAASWPEDLHRLIKRKIEKVIRFMTEDD